MTDLKHSLYDRIVGKIIMVAENTNKIDGQSPLTRLIINNPVNKEFFEEILLKGKSSKELLEYNGKKYNLKKIF